MELEEELGGEGKAGDKHVQQCREKQPEQGRTRAVTTHGEANRSFSLHRYNSLHSPWQEEDTWSAFHFTFAHIIFPICHTTEMSIPLGLGKWIFDCWRMLQECKVSCYDLCVRLFCGWHTFLRQGKGEVTGWDFQTRPILPHFADCWHPGECTRCSLTAQHPPFPSTEVPCSCNFVLPRNFPPAQVAGAYTEKRYYGELLNRDGESEDLYSLLGNFFSGSIKEFAEL